MGTEVPAMHHGRCHHKIYRLSCEDFDELWRYAKGRCEICKTPEAETKRGRLVIDHAGNYELCAVRGLLCDKCNSLMRRVDAGEKYDSRTHAYRFNAWFVRQLRKHRVCRQRERVAEEEAA